MKASHRVFLSLAFAICLLSPPVSSSASLDDTNRPTPLQESLDGTSLSPTATSFNDKIAFVHAFPFTDIRMKNNQEKYELLIEDFITSDLDSSQNITKTSEKYPLDSDLSLTIETKFAFHVLIDEVGVSLFTFTYDLVLNSCGVSTKNLKLLKIERKKGDIFNLESLPNMKYRMIIERLIKESSKAIISPEEQEIPLFITIHPALTFLPVAIIEDKLENLRVDFPKFNVRYCSACRNILPFDEYAYLTWLTLSGSASQEDSDFFSPKEQYMINLGLGLKTIFAAYPLDIVQKSNEDDKVVRHSYCVDKVRKTDTFVQNVYYERSLEKFTSDLVFYTVREIADKQDAMSSEVEVEFSCYPKYYKEKIDVFIIKGSGNLEKCKKDIAAFMQKNYIRSESSQIFDLPSYDMAWPLENLRDTSAIVDARIYIESEPLEELFRVHPGQDKYKITSMEEIQTRVDEYCQDFLAEEAGSSKQENSKKEYLNKCMHLIYINSLLRKLGVSKEKELRLQVKTKESEGWMKGVTIRNLEVFHNLEKEWFDLAQDRTLETYLLKLKDAQELEKQKAMSITFALVVMMGLTFWIGFIVRFRIKEATDSKDVKYR